MSSVRLSAIVTAALLAFAGNSLLCRAALQHTPVDAASFTTIRRISGAVTLSLLVPLSRRGWRLWLGEPLTLRLLLASAAFLGCVALVIRQQR